MCVLLRESGRSNRCDQCIPASMITRGSAVNGCAQKKQIAPGRGLARYATRGRAKCSVRRISSAQMTLLGEASSNRLLEERVCRACLLSKPLSEFGTNSNGYPRCYCKRCQWKKQTAYKKTRWSTPEGAIIKAAREQRFAERRSQRRLRADPADVATFVTRDCKKADKRRGLENDLDRDFVLGLVSAPCVYCGEDKLRMTLDRVDNALGHTKANVVGACMRCNFTRGAMPYEAWLCVVPGMRQAREAGLFGTWAGRAFNRVKPDPEASRIRNPNRNTKSGYTGVYWEKSHGKWRAKIVASGKFHRLGSFDCKHEAARAYNAAALRLHGERAVLNVIQEDAAALEPLQLTAAREKNTPPE